MAASRWATDGIGVAGRGDVPEVEEAKEDDGIGCRFSGNLRFNVSIVVFNIDSIALAVLNIFSGKISG